MQMFPLSVELQVKETGLSFTFYYLPALGIVTVEASTKAGNALLATLFRGDTGKDTPSEANHYIDEGSYDFPSDAKARPYRCDATANCTVVCSMLQVNTMTLPATMSLL